jgi:ABC-type antimicrobial peptide transport system permease subunit
MLKNYLKITWRSLLRQKAFSLINILGLAIGMASAALILFWVQNEFSYDQFHTKKDRLYQVYNRSVFDGKLWCWGTTPKIMAKTLKQDYSQIEEVTHTTGGNFLFTVGEKRLNIDGMFTDQGFLNIFSFPLVSGNQSTALKNNNSIVITEKLSKKLFGNDNAMGKVIKIDSNAYFTVTGVMKDLPNNTLFNFEYLIPWTYLKKIGGDDPNWGNNSCQTWALVKPNVTEEAANKSIINITRTHSNVKDIDVFLHPARKWRLYSNFDQKGHVSGGRIAIVKTFSIIAAFILLIACINFMNLSTARSEKRAREVGIRKVVGALRGSLISQFLGESILVAFISGAFALLIVQLSMSGFNLLTDKHLFVPYGNPWFWLASIGFIVFTGAISGSYPALYLSSFRPVSVLKGTFKAANALITPRKLLVVVQFTFAVVLIICTIIVRQQLQYAQDRDTGYKKNNLVYVMMTGNMDKHFKLIKNELLSSGAASAVSKTSAPVTQGWSDSWDFLWAGKDISKKIDFNVFNTDGDLAKTMGLKVVEGRDIDAKNYPTDSTAILLNEAAVKIMGFKNPIGQIVKRGEAPNYQELHVVGVVKDFILQSPYEPIKAMIIQGPKSWFNVIHFRLNNTNSTADNLKRAEKVFKKYNPDYPFEYNFIDQDYAKKFGDEQRIQTLAGLFAGLTIIISCLGLFGLAAYMAQNRIKEIGVRKVLGASVLGVTALLSKDFLKLVFVSLFIASPIAWYFMNKWLGDYNYRISISIWVFVSAALVTIVISLITISFQTIKAAIANPVKSLRSE